MNPSNEFARTFAPLRIRVASMAAVVAVIGILAAPLLEPSGAESSTEKGFRLARAHQAASFSSVWADLIGFCATAFVAATVIGVARNRGVWLTTIGGWLTTISTLVIGLNTMGFAQIVLARQTDQQAAIHIYNQITSSAALIPFLVIAVLSVVGPVLLAFGLWRARLAGWWLPLLAVLGIALFLALGGGDSSSAAGFVVQIPVCIQIATWGWLLRSRLPQPTTRGESAPVAVATV